MVWRANSKQEEAGALDFGAVPEVPGLKTLKIKQIYAINFFVFVNDRAQ